MADTGDMKDRAAPAIKQESSHDETGAGKQSWAPGRLDSQKPWCQMWEAAQLCGRPRDCLSGYHGVWNLSEVNCSLGKQKLDKG